MGGKARALAVDAALGGLVAAAMALPMLGVRLEDGATGLSLGGRFDWVLWAAGIVAGGRLLIGALRLTLAGRGPSLPAPPRALITYVGWAMVAFALILPFLPFAGRNMVDKATLVLIYVMLGWGLNIVVGLAGLLDLGFVAFYAVGAYSYALLSQTFGLSFWLCLPLAGMLAAGFGLVLGFPVLRLRGDYIAIVTMGLGEIIRVVLQNWQDVTGGPNGISGIERPSFFGLSFKMVPPEGSRGFAEFFGLDYSADHRVIFLYFLILALALLTNLFTLRIRRLPVGRAWEALREDEIACRSLGINPTTVKLSAFATGAMFAGFAGSFFATRQGFISPESFTFHESAVILAIVVLGGMGSQIGIVLAALLLVGLPEWFRELQQFRMLAFGGAMVLIMLWKPSGLLSTREPAIRLKDAP
ncbi:ABC-type branched-chain amino acid transport system protein [Paramagnetospirillum caucaseum]|uniref:ABC-type branched-chain amino acid transport system protein n=1 Tax=Paramagnetospirillum caucaseum TaxID=1244869 RepID=M2ZUL8_9PROT|nr:high-affinity branched-chain amino acid ABC transporter permease LivM [Paramagnetospirillum caucaseum]EME71072.1 ABC-type branched-chain amino acid transport system protein [Paramagnetospirillum caucaseum]